MESIDVCPHPFLQSLIKKGLIPPSDETSVLCDRCDGITFDALKSSDGYFLSDTILILVDSAQQCDLCKIILLTCLTYDGELVEPPLHTILRRDRDLVVSQLKRMVGLEKSIFLRLCLDPDSGCTKLEIIGRGGSDLDIGHLELYTHPDWPRIDKIPQGISIRPYPNTEAQFYQFREWISQCQSNHERCSAKICVPSLPTRVLDLGTSGSTSTLRLLETNHTKGTYLTLSHRWGNHQPLTTTKATLAAHCQQLQFYGLPKTFQDAVIITGNLGVRHLWIDSLCIVQDDSNDWAQESKVMGEIYANSLCTIAATAAKNCNDGIFVERKVAKSVYLEIENSADPIRLLARPYFEIARDALNAELNSRGWVLQERMLSPRILHFTAEQVFWECRSVVNHEDLRGSKIQNNRTDIYSGVTWTQIKSRSNDLASILHLIDDYTACHLTYQKDKLVAFTGIMNQLSRHFTVSFIAGVCSELLPRSLMWIHAEDKPLVPLPELCLPSWSWASYCGSLRHLYTVYEGFEPDGNSKIAIHGDFAIATSRTATILTGSLSTFQSGMTFTNLTSNSAGAGLDFDVHSHTGAWIGVIHMDEIFAPHGKHLQCISVGFLRESGSSSRGDHREHIVLLVEPTTSPPDYWKRIGMGHIKVNYFVDRDGGLVKVI